jgi:hypothetical protein
MAALLGSSVQQQHHKGWQFDDRQSQHVQPQAKHDQQHEGGNDQQLVLQQPPSADYERVTEP